MELSLQSTTLTLIENCLQGNRESYRLLYDQYAKAMYNTAFRILNNQADAEDILQEAFIDAFQTLKNFRNQASFGSWLKRIVIHKSINHIKRDRKNWVEVDRQEIDQYAYQDEAEPDEAEFVYRVESIKQAIRLLPDGYRTVLSLHLIENIKQEDIAQLLGISHATVRTQYLRAKKKLLTIITQQDLL
ncbi:MAG: sigma-70 family RNA polymerase sigma factor [Bacteroidota bacterium]|nr:sigma-70 family RNA polymerase sigma factor [Bacteroidota bacterium]